MFDFVKNGRKLFKTVVSTKIVHYQQIAISTSENYFYCSCHQQEQIQTRYGETESSQN